MALILYGAVAAIGLGAGAMASYEFGTDVVYSIVLGYALALFAAVLWVVSRRS